MTKIQDHDPLFCPCTLLSIACLTAKAQERVFNNFLDTTVSPNKEIYQLWNNYFKARKADASPFWRADEEEKFRSYDLLKSWGCGGTYSEISHVLKIMQIDSNTFELKVGMGFADSNSASILSVLKFIVKKEDNIYRLSNYLLYKTRDWKSYSTEWLNFHYPPDYTFDAGDARKSELFLEKMYQLFDIKPYHIEFYVATGLSEIQEAAGYESFIDDGIRNIGGCYDGYNNIVFSGNGIYYPHELVHVINDAFPKSHSLFLCGISGLLGGHFGKPLSYHQKRLQVYLKNNRDKIVSLTDFYYMDTYTNPQYLVGGLFCEEAIRIGGYDKLKKLMSYGTGDEDFYTAIKNEFGIEKEQLINYFFRKMGDDKLFANY